MDNEIDAQARRDDIESSKENGSGVRMQIATIALTPVPFLLLSRRFHDHYPSLVWDVWAGCAELSLSGSLGEAKRVGRPGMVVGAFGAISTGEEFGAGASGV